MYHDLCKQILEEGVDPNCLANSQSLFRVCCFGDIQILNLLIKHDINPQALNISFEGKTHLQLACYRGHHSVLSHLLKLKTLSVCEPNSRGQTPLIIAVFYKQPQCAMVLLDSGLECNISHSAEGRTALGLARQRGLHGVVRKLKKMGAVEF